MLKTSQVLQMSGLFLAFDDHIVNVRLHHVTKLRTERQRYRSLLGCTGIFKAEGHNLVAVDAPRRNKSHHPSEVTKVVFSISSESMAI